MQWSVVMGDSHGEDRVQWSAVVGDGHGEDGPQWSAVTEDGHSEDGAPSRRGGTPGEAVPGTSLLLRVPPPRLTGSCGVRLRVWHLL